MYDGSALVLHCIAVLVLLLVYHVTITDFDGPHFRISQVSCYQVYQLIALSC